MIEAVGSLLPCVELLPQGVLVGVTVGVFVDVYVIVGVDVIMVLWKKAFGDGAAEIGELTKASDKDLNYLNLIALKDAFTEIACEGRGWNAKSVGWWMSHNMDIVKGDYYFQRVVGNHTSWKLSKAQGELV